MICSYFAFRFYLSGVAPRFYNKKILHYAMEMSTLLPITSIRTRACSFPDRYKTI